MKSKKIYLAVLVIATVVLTACGGGGQTTGVTVKAEDLKFTPNTLTAKVGDSVTVNLQNAGALEHSFIIDEFSVRLEGVQPGQTGSVSFTPSAAGTYTFYCDVPGHKEAGMVGTLTVNP
ncbi:MAG TPA: cupredoxin domain-containing protein [Anaerolineales bacterium]|nr:cupredoxin domain-containing protein [Anaerolineales bacterium]